ncbi:MAG: hypothetical protein F6K54_13800 [Okeania sp. SIO3B5]|uniref:hypothetical protein n=1 Tax=Okeania sp. SIO3B5 TaxID=2607811 RepID=UPI0013FEA63A|nr:hypothetical protein [Okeania sp. SIO3B5]NEO54056.1 hypothetical protein [Okeania sp. SIO3B5]
MGWNYYGLDQVAQELVLDAKKRNSDSLNQSFKMRMAIPYGLERFWGEHLRLQKRENDKSLYWKSTWDKFVEIMAKTNVTIPNEPVTVDDTKAIKEMSQKLWQLHIDDQRVAIAVLTQLCDCLVWWTQRYK